MHYSAGSHFSAGIVYGTRMHYSAGYHFCAGIVHGTRVHYDCVGCHFRAGIVVWDGTTLMRGHECAGTLV